MKNGTHYFFDDSSHKKLTRIVERNGNQLTLNYTTKNLTSIIDASGRTITLIWTSNRLSEVKADFDEAVKTIKYSYDPAGTLKSVKDPGGNIIAYTYIRNKLMGTLTDANGNVTTILYSHSNQFPKVGCRSHHRYTSLYDHYRPLSDLCYFHHHSCS